MAPFKYMATSMVHSKAHIETCMVGLGNGDFCACGKHDCLTAGVPCQCAKGTGGQFAYNKDGLLKDWFLQSSGPVHRTFITECNVKCGCCGNTLV